MLGANLESPPGLALAAKRTTSIYGLKIVVFPSFLYMESLLTILKYEAFAFKINTLFREIQQNWFEWENSNIFVENEIIIHVWMPSSMGFSYIPKIWKNLKTLLLIDNSINRELLKFWRVKSLQTPYIPTSSSSCLLILVAFNICRVCCKH